MNLSAIVFAPHPDDETLGCGGTIIRKVANGARVDVVIMTDGRASHGHLISAEELVAIRAAEVRNACSAMGLQSDSLTILGFPDQGLAKHRHEAIAAVRELLRHRQPEEIFIPHAADPMEDHQATNEIIGAALAEYPSDVLLMEYPIWLWNTWPWTKSTGFRKLGKLNAAHKTFSAVSRLVLGCSISVDVSEVLEQKSTALCKYESQTLRRHGNPNWGVLSDVSDADFIACFLQKNEIFRQTHLDTCRSCLCTTRS